MRMKRIEIIGFKSFCDKAVLDFRDPITGVVGPNGCGKSNIVDAIRWCMGEQSAKHLRGKAMDDVIFAGSETRGPGSMAEVSLTFENVGFNHETIELALAEQQEDSCFSLDEGAQENDVPVEVEGNEQARVPEVTEDPPVTTATEEVEAFLKQQTEPIDFSRYTEVTVTRRLFRDGTSLYLINKTPCRLREVRDFFLGTGVGTKAYSIVEQGRMG